MTLSLERDLIGYGAHPPKPNWPGEARLALNFVLNYEEGSEYNIGDGDGLSDSGLVEMPGSPVPLGERDLAAESMFEYGSRVGFWRLMRIFAERDLPMTVYACALALERNLCAAEAIKAAQHDICCHGWRWVEHYKLTEEEERNHIKLAIDSLKKTIGERPLGWYCRYGPSVNTRKLLMEEGGFLYDSDSYNDELPYYVIAEGLPQLVIPYTLTNNDLKWGTSNFGTGEDFFVYLRESFDVLYDEGLFAPKMMNVGMHMRLLGHPGRASGLIRFLDYVKTKPDVWICKRIDIARHWLKTHPFRETE
ncbi:allantoinase PuuE [Agrobacterium vitis]|uniref:allantoinase PuuE n=1 Tax=Agrobacterium vitis TaxID=373 RepID=UPI001F466299|nr:allantoinase PuuE [Agrobacterium vitis]MCF1467529.1 allantoinase PuuE [Agrobacterium vitis]